MIIFHDNDTLLHETVELLGSKLRSALESPNRIRAIVDALKTSNKTVTEISSGDSESTVIELALATHTQDYLHHIQHVHQDWLEAGLVEPDESVLAECFRIYSHANANPRPPKDIYARAGYYAFDMSSGISQHSWRSIVASANLAAQAAKAVSREAEKTDPNHTTALALCRPPGHHCTGTQAGGYCYINNVAVAISALRESHPTSKYAILDLDFHHGNGSQEMYYHDPNVFYVSIHGEDEFPYYTGAAHERGPPDHAAYGTNLNFPLVTGSSSTIYLETLSAAISAIVDFDPAYLLVSLGFDTFHLDPLGKFDIDTDDYRAIACTVRSKLKMPTVILLEGGYVIDRLGENLLSFIDGWEAAGSE